jgi:hypothetical protein
MRNLGLALLFLFSIVNNAFTQDYSTNGEIYDFEIGDIFHYEMEGWDHSSHGFEITNKEIIDKTFSDDLDTVYYTQFVKKLYQLDWQEWIYEEDTTQISYTDLDSLFAADTTYYSYAYNGRKISSNFTNWWDIEFDIVDYADGCGRVYNHHYRTEYPVLDYEWEMVYYKKGDEEWGIPNVVVGIEELKYRCIMTNCYPNPFTTSTTLSFRLEKPENVQFTVYNVQSKIVYTIEDRRYAGEQQIQWNAEGLPVGVYYFRVQAGDKVGGGKMIKTE